MLCSAVAILDTLTSYENSYYELIIINLENHFFVVERKLNLNGCYFILGLFAILFSLSFECNNRLFHSRLLTLAAFILEFIMYCYITLKSSLFVASILFCFWQVSFGLWQLFWLFWHFNTTSDSFVSLVLSCYFFLEIEN